MSLLINPLPSVGELNELFEYRDGNLYWKVDRRGHKVKGQLAGGVSKKGYRHVRVAGVYYKVHRLIWKMHYGTDPGPYLDHINGNKLDNRIGNLREVDNSTNCLNRKQKNYQRTRSGRYTARTMVNYKYVHLGTHDTIEEAEAAVHKFKKERDEGYYYST